LQLRLIILFLLFVTKFAIATDGELKRPSEERDAPVGEEDDGKGWISMPPTEPGFSAGHWEMGNAPPVYSTTFGKKPKFERTGECFQAIENANRRAKEGAEKMLAENPKPTGKRKRTASLSPDTFGRTKECQDAVPLTPLQVKEKAIQISINTKKNTMTVMSYGKKQKITIRTKKGTIETDEWPISHGRPGHQTARGCYQPFWFHKDHHSSIYNNASMRNSIFFYPAMALHKGDPGVASHGCIHVGGNGSNELWDLIVGSNTKLGAGIQNTSVCVN
jgi:hypothetical protein